MLVQKTGHKRYLSHSPAGHTPKRRRSADFGDHAIDDYSVHRANVDSAYESNPTLSDGNSMDYANVESTGASGPALSDTGSVASASITV